MLTRNHLITLGFAALTVPLAACFVTVTDDDSSLGGFGGQASTTASTGTTISTTNTTTSTGTVTPGCTDPAGTGQVESKCDEMANFSATCPSSGEAPLGVAVCHQGFHVYTAGSWDDLEACLESIPATLDDTCDANAESNVTNCVDTVYTKACANADALTTCNNVAQSCADAMDPNFATDMCKADLNPFSEEGLNAYIACANENSATQCADLHDFCLNQVLSF